MARGEAQWTNGYRTARAALGAESETEDARLCAVELAQFKECGTREKAVARALTAYARLIRKSGR